MTPYFMLNKGPWRGITELMVAGGPGLSGGCAKYHSFPLDPLRPEFHRSAIWVGEVGASCEILDETSSKRYFNRNLTKGGFRPIQFTVTNGPDRHLILQDSQISVPAARPEAVA